MRTSIVHAVTTLSKRKGTFFMNVEDLMDAGTQEEIL